MAEIRTPDEMLAVAVAQFAPTADQTANVIAIRDLATQAAERGAKIVVFPEYSSYFTVELGAHSVAAAQALNGEFVTAMRSIARALGIVLVAGMIETSPDPTKLSNTIVAIDQHGELVAFYRKIHLYDAFGQRESDWVVAGAIEEPQTFVVGSLTVALQTCYDIRFPEVTRRLVDAGAQLVLLPSEWVRGPLKEHHWRTLIAARAIENTVYIAAADHAPPIGIGHSMIVDPMGVELVTIGENTATALAWISGTRVAEVRALNPALGLRRFAIHPRE